MTGQFCTATMTSGATGPVSECYLNRDVYPSLTLPTIFTPLATTDALVTVSEIGLVAPMVEIRWKSSDRPVSTTSLTTSSSTSTNRPTSPSAIETHPKERQGSDPALSTGEKWAIGVVVHVVVVAAVIAVLCIRRRRRRRNRASAQHWYSPRQVPPQPTPIMSVKDGAGKKHMSELAGSDGAMGSVQEMESPSMYRPDSRQLERVG